MTPQPVDLMLPRTEEKPRQTKGMSAAEYGVLAEELGFDAVWTPESWGGDSFVELASIVERTTDITVGTAIVHVFTRSPAVLAMAAASLSRLSDGRVILGVGVGHPDAIEGLHGLRFDRPVRRTHETIELVKLLLNGDGPVSYDGEMFQIESQPSLGVDVPVYNAALGEANRRATGRVADGWIPYNVPFSRFASAFETVASAARNAGRSPDHIEVAPVIPVAVSDDGAEARDVIRTNIASYLGRFDDGTYTGIVGRTYPDKTEQIARAWREGNRAEAIETVPDDLVDDMGVAGTPETARRRLQEIQADPVVDRPILLVPLAASTSLTKRTIQELAPEQTLDT